LFTILGMKLVKKEKGLLSFILPSGPLLYNNSPKPINFRKWLFGKYNVPQVIDFTYLSNILFKNKGNEKNVAVSAFFLENKAPDESPIYHITVKKLKTAKERQYFEIDHYDFHKVSKADAVENPFVWKSNLLGGGRLIHLIKRISSFPVLEDYLLKKEKNDNWSFGVGFIVGNRKYLDKDRVVFMRNNIPTAKFTESGFGKNDIIIQDTDEYIEARRKADIYSPPLLLIKRSIGNKTIPVCISDSYITYRDEIIGIHSPEKDKGLLLKIKDRIHFNQLYRFYLITTSARAGITKSAFPVYKKDIMNLPFPENEEEIELTKFDEILVNDTLKYGLDYLGRDTNIKVLKATSQEELICFGNVFCEVLNSLFETELKKYTHQESYITDSFICTIFSYSNANFNTKKLINETEIESHIAEMVYNKLGTSYRINRVVKIYDGDLIYLVKPKELRYWLESIALRDADETILDLYNAGY
jgi:hypothetical protein